MRRLRNGAIESLTGLISVSSAANHSGLGGSILASFFSKPHLVVVFWPVASITARRWGVETFKRCSMKEFIERSNMA